MAVEGNPEGAIAIAEQRIDLLPGELHGCGRWVTGMYSREPMSENADQD